MKEAYLTPDNTITVDLATGETAKGIGALIGFGLMFVWIAFYFTRHDKSAAPTPQKAARNTVYIACSSVMGVAVALFALGAFGIMGNYITFIAEEFLLIPAGVALIVKSGKILKDKEEK